MKFSKAFIAAALTLSSLSASAEYETIKSPEEAQAIRQAVGIALLGVREMTCTDLQEKSITYPISSITAALTSTSTIFRDLGTQPVLKFLRTDMGADTTGYVLISTDSLGKRITKITFKNISQEKVLRNIGTIAQPRLVEGSPKVVLQQDCTVPSSNGVK